VGAAPNAQFWGQIIGSAVGAVVSALIYKLYTNVYDVRQLLELTFPAFFVFNSPETFAPDL
jgi:uncharacterized oligopeptide transporter (OPT) family protein